MAQTFYRYLLAPKMNTADLLACSPTFLIFHLYHLHLLRAVHLFYACLGCIVSGTHCRRHFPRGKHIKLRSKKTERVLSRVKLHSADSCWLLLCTPVVANFQPLCAALPNMMAPLQWLVSWLLVDTTSFPNSWLPSNRFSVILVCYPLPLAMMTTI